MSANQSWRVDALLAEARRNPRRQITTSGALRLYSRLGIAPKRTTARADLKALARRGVLIERGPRNQRHYALSIDH
ncbi:hypothetical protein [Streptomyces sp. R41]|uniref:Uncharacterized protein n=1 Tax=Streptomyces sp. R41 TaxID=3238632 RepID=A0AB39RJ86_9ACTN